MAKMNWSRLLLCGVVGLDADIKYTQETTMVDNAAFKTLMSRAVKPNFERYESVTDMGVYKTQDVTIRECGKKQTIKLAPDLKIVTPEQFDQQKQAAMMKAMMGGMANDD